METNPMNPNPSNPMGPSDEVIKGMDTSTHKIFGVPRRAIAFGFGSLLMLVVLAVLYSIFTRQPADMPMIPSKTDMKNEMKSETSKSSTPAIVGEVTPDRVADDLIDEALSDRDDLSDYDSDEQADVQDGSNN